MKQPTTTTQEPAVDPDLARLETLATWLDNRFRIPGTNIRFGFDGLIGLIPYVGDLAGFAVSGLLFSVMLRRGAGPLLLLRMMGNFAIDTLVGAVPFLGDLFDFGFKANRRNVELLKNYYATDESRPSVRSSVLFLLFLALLFMIGLIWLTGRLLAWVWNAASILWS